MNSINILHAAILLIGLTAIHAVDYSLFDCPTSWDEYEDHCYLFMQSILSSSEAKQACQTQGAYVVAVHSDLEHRFIENRLEADDGWQRRRYWWTSGRRKSSNPNQFFWEGDGTDITSAFYWHNSSIPEDMSKTYIMYSYDGTQWAWILVGAQEEGPTICKISKEDVYKITDEKRGPDYGINDPDPLAIPIGPYFIVQPTDIIHVTPESASKDPNNAQMECIARGNPAPTYTWYKIRAGQTTKLDSSTDSRYSFISGRLTISDPSRSSNDDGTYFCMATNNLGTIVSESISLQFGFLDDFSKTPRSDVNVVAYQHQSIECNPPAHYPEIQYMWYKNFPGDFIRPDLKPYLFISHDGRLYFSEVTKDDVGEYFCIVNMPRSTSSYSVESMPTKLVVNEGSPGIYDPQIGPNFPFVYPANPFVGDTVLLECWASGSYTMPLEYSWDRVEVKNPDEMKCESSNVLRYLPLPVQARQRDHNRVLEIPNIFLYDAGVYRCSVRRPNGGNDCETAQIILQSEPYFIVELENQYVDVGSDLTWRCDASGEDGNGPHVTYKWLKNGLPLADQIPPEDIDRVKIQENTLLISNLNAEKDNGMYQCEATNLHGVKHSSAELRVLSFQPSFTKHPMQSKLYATNQGNLTIECDPEAAPVATITWYKNGSPLNPGEDENSRIRQLPNGNLVISPVYVSDAGLYKCQAENVLGLAESSGNLTVLSTVTIPLPPLTQTIELNKTTFLHCMASYHPGVDVTYTWFHQDRLIEFEKVYRLGEDRYEIWRDPHWKRGSGLYNGGLYIMHAQYMHTGRYTCVVESRLGDHFERWADVTVLGPPSEVPGVVHDILTVTTTSVSITWKAGGNNGGVIESYVIEALNYWEGFWRIIYTNVVVTPDLTGTYAYNVTNLRPYSRYQLRMRAENMYGTSIPSKTTDEFVTQAVKPDLYPKFVGGGGGKVGDLTITWQPLDPWEENGPRFGYRVFWKPTGDEEFDDDQVQLVEENVGKCVILVGEQNLYRDYDTAVQAYNKLTSWNDDMSFGPLSPLVTVKSAMGIPKAVATNVRAIPFNSTACIMTWDPADDTPDNMRGKLGGYKLAYWNVKLGPDYENPWRVTMSGQMSEGLVIGLEPNTQYYFAVYVWTEAGTGQKSQYFLQRTLRRAPINQPVEVKIYIKSETAIQVYWRGVSTTHLEEPLTGYKVRIWREGQEIKVAKDYDAGKRTNLYIDDLKPDILYNLRVFGYSRGGDGTMSSPALDFMTDSGPIKKYSITLLTLLLSFSVFMSSQC